MNPRGIWGGYRTRGPGEFGGNLELGGDMVACGGLELAALHDWRSGGALRGILEGFREGFGVLQAEEAWGIGGAEGIWAGVVGGF